MTEIVIVTNDGKEYAYDADAILPMLFKGCFAVAKGYCPVAFVALGEFKIIYVRNVPKAF